MARLATFLLAASLLVPASLSAQTVEPKDRDEGTPQVPLRQPGATAVPGQTAAPMRAPAPAPIARPAPPAAPTPPAGITWRNQAGPAPTTALPARPAPLPALGGRALAAPPPPPPVAGRPFRADAAPPLPPPPIAAPGAPSVRRFVIQRRPGAPGPDAREFEIIREGGPMMNGPARVIVRRERIEEPFAEDYSGFEDHLEDEPGDYADRPWMDDEEFLDRHGYHHDDQAGARYGHADRGHHGYGHPGYATSGGMITETITTTTTYPPTVEERVVHERAPAYRPMRRGKSGRR